MLIGFLLLWGSSWLTPAQAQQGPPKYQFMHVNLQSGRIYYSPAYQSKEWVRVQDYMGQSFTLTDKNKLEWEAMSRLLTDLSGQGWELVSVIPDNDKTGMNGATYLLRHQLP